MNALTGVGAIVAVTILAAMCSPERPAPSNHTTSRAPQPPAASNDHPGARGACQIFVKRSLRKPDAADWGDISTWTVIDNNDGSLSVGARYLSAEGGAGTSRYTTCIIRRTGNEWKLDKLSRMQ